MPKTVDDARDYFPFDPRWIASVERVDDGGGMVGTETTAKDFAAYLATMGQYNILYAPNEIDPDADHIDLKFKAAHLTRWTGHLAYRNLGPMAERIRSNQLPGGFEIFNPVDDIFDAKVDPAHVLKAHPENGWDSDPFILDIRRIRDFRSAYSVPVFLRLSVWDAHEDLAPAGFIRGGGGMCAFQVHRDDVSSVLGIGLKDGWVMGHLNRLLVLIGKDLASAGVPTAFSWNFVGNKAVSLSVQWRVLPFDAKPAKPDSRVVFNPFESSGSSYSRRRGAQPLATVTDEGVQDQAMAPAIKQDNLTPAPVADVPASTPMPSIPRRRLGVPSSANETSTPQAPDAEAPVWTPPAGETYEQQMERWKSAGNAVYSRGADKFPDPTDHPDLDMVLRIIARVSYPELFDTSDDKWYDQLESEGIKVVRYKCDLNRIQIAAPDDDPRNVIDGYLDCRTEYEKNEAKWRREQEDDDPDSD